MRSLKSLAVFVLWSVPSLALAQSPALPSLWNCVAETKAQCYGTDCEIMAVNSTVEVDFINWSYARCSEGCYGGQSNTWVEDTEGNVMVLATDMPQHLVLQRENRFVDVAWVAGKTYISEGRCWPALKDQTTRLPILEVYAAFKDWQDRVNFDAQAEPNGRQ